MSSRARSGRGGRGGGRGSGQGGRRADAINRGQQEIRLRQLRDLIYPQATATDLLRRILEAEGWDVARAHALWARLRTRALTGVDPDADETASVSSLSSSSSLASLASSGANDDLGPGPNSSSNHPLQQAVEDSDLPFNNNVEQERRDTALAFRMQIEEIHQIALSISEALLLLYLADWDIGVAIAEFQNHHEARDRLRVAFDGMRHRTSNVNEQSARITALVDITERADWLSIKLFLEKNKWRFVRALVAWYKHGIRPYTNDEVQAVLKDRPHWALRVDHNGSVRPKPTEEECRAEQEVEADGWADESHNFTNPNDTNPPAPVLRRELQGRNYNTERTRAPGFIIHAGENSTIKPGPSDQKKFLFEYISKGQYRFNLFEHPKYFFPDRAGGLRGFVDESSMFEDSENADDTNLMGKSSLFTSSPSSSPSPPAKGGKRTKNTKADAKSRKRSKYTKPVVDFDFETPSHLADLNAWRRQNRSRIEGATLRDAAQTWTPEELEFLYQLSKEWLEDLKAQHPTKTRRDLLETSEIPTSTKQDWQSRMSERFTGTIQAGSKTPRRDRKPAAIMTMRGRYPRLFIHFRVNPDKKWLARVDPAEVARLENERDGMEGIDLLLTANAILEARDQHLQQIDDRDNDGDDEEEQQESEGASDVADDGDR